MPKGERKCQKREANGDFKFKEASLASGQRQPSNKERGKKMSPFSKQVSDDKQTYQCLAFSFISKYQSIFKVALKGKTSKM